MSNEVPVEPSTPATASRALPPWVWVAFAFAALVLAGGVWLALTGGAVGAALPTWVRDGMSASSFGSWVLSSVGATGSANPQGGAGQSGVGRGSGTRPGVQPSAWTTNVDKASSGSWDSLEGGDWIAFPPSRMRVTLTVVSGGPGPIGLEMTRDEYATVRPWNGKKVKAGDVLTGEWEVETGGPYQWVVTAPAGMKWRLLVESGK